MVLMQKQFRRTKKSFVKRKMFPYLWIDQFFVNNINYIAVKIICISYDMLTVTFIRGLRKERNLKQTDLHVQICIQAYGNNSKYAFNTNILHVYCTNILLSSSAAE